MDNQDNGAAPVATEEPRVTVYPPEDQAAEPAAEIAPAEQPETAADAGTAEQDESAPEAGAGDAEKEAAPVAEPRFKGTAKKRIQELNRRAQEQAQEAAYWRSIALGQQQPQQTQQPQPPQFDPTPYIGPAPTPASFPAGEYDPAYIEERAVYRLKAEQAKAEITARQHQQRMQETTLLTQAQQRMAAESARLPDLPDAVAYLADRLPSPVANAVAELIATSEHGADVAVSLASDDALSARIAQLPPHRAAIELGKLEARIESRKQAASQTKAPPPPPTVTGHAAPPRKGFMQMSDGEAANWIRQIAARR